MLTPYPGKAPSNVNKDAKYSVKYDDQGGMCVRLVYRLGLREVALLTTSSHQPLVDMVNAVKQEAQGVAGGVFYINEWGHVIVPANDQCYYAGRYDPLLEFEFTDGSTISPEPPPDLKPGDEWLGPHVGVAYILKADGDIAYKIRKDNIETT